MRNQYLGARIRPFLEAYSFAFLHCDVTEETTVDDIRRRVGEAVVNDTTRWDRMLVNLAEACYLEEGLRYILIQIRSLAPAKRYALAGAAAFGFLDLLPTDARPQLTIDPVGNGVSNELAAACGVAKLDVTLGGACGLQ